MYNIQVFLKKLSKRISKMQNAHVAKRHYVHRLLEFADSDMRLQSGRATSAQTPTSRSSAEPYRTCLYFLST